MPWNSQIFFPNCSLVKAYSLATLKANSPRASDLAEFPILSALNPEICFLNPPGPNKIFS